MRLRKIFPDNTRFRFGRLPWFAFALTILLTGASIALVASGGLTLGVDFVGGLMIEAGFEQPVPLDKLRRDIGRMDVGDVSLQAFGGPRNIAIRLPLPPGDAAAVQATVKRVQAEIAEEYTGVRSEERRVGKESVRTCRTQWSPDHN